MLHKFSPFHYHKGSNLWNPLGRCLTLHLEALEFEIEGFKNQKNRGLKPPTKYEVSQLGPEVLLKMKNHRTTGENLPKVRSGGFRFGSIWSWSSVGGGISGSGIHEAGALGATKECGPHTRERVEHQHLARGWVSCCVSCGDGGTWSLPSRPIPAWLLEILVLPCCKPL